MTATQTVPIESPIDIQPPEPTLTAEEMLERAKGLRPVLRERQAKCEELGRLPDETNNDFLNAGFYRIVQPRCFGGYEFSITDYIRVMAEVSRGCPESGWVLALTSGHPANFIAGFPEQGQRDAYGLTGDCRAPCVFLPGGTAIPVGGGYLIKGTWDYCSGCDIATHFLGGLTIVDPETQAIRAQGYALVDLCDYRIVDNWDVMGMRGTGSRRVVIEEMVVPEHRMLVFADAQMREVPHPGRALHSNPLYKGPTIPFLLIELASVAVGAAQGALDIYDEILREKKWNFPPFPRRFEVIEYQQRFAQAQGWIDTAEAALLTIGAKYVDIAGREAQNGTPFDAETRRRLVRVCQQCIELSWNAVELIFRTGGTSSTGRLGPLARYFRNMAVIRTHFAVQTDQFAANLGRVHFGLPPTGPG